MDHDGWKFVNMAASKGRQKVKVKKRNSESESEKRERKLVMMEVSSR